MTDETPPSSDDGGLSPDEQEGAIAALLKSVPSYPMVGLRLRSRDHVAAALDPILVVIYGEVAVRYEDHTIIAGQRVPAEVDESGTLLLDFSNGPLGASFGGFQSPAVEFFDMSEWDVLTNPQLVDGLQVKRKRKRKLAASGRDGERKSGIL